MQRWARARRFFRPLSCDGGASGVRLREASHRPRRVRERCRRADPRSLTPETGRRGEAGTQKSPKIGRKSRKFRKPSFGGAHPHSPPRAQQPENQTPRQRHRTTGPPPRQAGGGAHPRPDEGRRNQPRERARNEPREGEDQQPQHHRQREQPREARAQGEQQQPHQQRSARGSPRQARQPEPEAPGRRQANQEREQADRQQGERRQANQGTNHQHKPRGAHDQTQREQQRRHGSPQRTGATTSPGLRVGAPSLHASAGRRIAN